MPPHICHATYLTCHMPYLRYKHFRHNLAVNLYLLLSRREGERDGYKLIVYHCDVKTNKKTLEAFSAAALFSFSLAISALACSMILFASEIVCSGLSVVDSSVDRDDAEVEVGVVANVDRVDSADSDGVEVDVNSGDNDVAVD